MALEQKLSLKLATRLVMTPSLQQAIKLLQMTRLELESVLEQELVENPVLEEVEEISVGAEAGQLDGDAAADAGGEREEAGALSEIDFDAYFGDDGDGSATGWESETREAPPLENTLTREPDLYDHLLWQVAMSPLSPRERRLAELVIGNLDPDGFLVATVEEIRSLAGCEDCTPAEVEAVIRRVQELDPPGIACVDLRESLRRQLAARGESPEALPFRIVSEAWDLLLRR
ncbi:MAG TPA: RNA polymerase sigma-54 factor, partial [Thermoanaerobaculia bacterium]|nr:RNA polymerase sigma-54 factor [Thermoanaerobaculia bacterium]